MRGNRITVDFMKARTDHTPPVRLVTWLANQAGYHLGRSDGPPFRRALNDLTRLPDWTKGQHRQWFRWLIEQILLVKEFDQRQVIATLMNRLHECIAASKLPEDHQEEVARFLEDQENGTDFEPSRYHKLRHQVQALTDDESAAEARQALASFLPYLNPKLRAREQYVSRYLLEAAIAFRNRQDRDSAAAAGWKMRQEILPEFLQGLGL